MSDREKREERREKREERREKRGERREERGERRGRGEREGMGYMAELVKALAS